MYTWNEAGETWNEMGNMDTAENMGNICDMFDEPNQKDANMGEVFNLDDTDR